MNRAGRVQVRKRDRLPATFQHAPWFLEVQKSPPREAGGALKLFLPFSVRPDHSSPESFLLGRLSH